MGFTEIQQTSDLCGSAADSGISLAELKLV